MKKLLLILMLLVTPLLSQTQKPEQATFMVTADIGYRTVTDELFSDVYGSSGLMSYGATSLIHISGPFIADVGYHLGKKSGTTTGSMQVETNISLSTYNIGVAYAWGRSIQNYIGGGYAGCSAKEELVSYNTVTESGGGYYVVYGLASIHNSFAYNLSIKYMGITIDSQVNDTAKIGGLEILFGIGFGI
jgi:hypothetical protein